MRKVRYFLLLMVLSNTFCLQHTPWIRALYQEPVRISVKMASQENLLEKHEMNARVIEHLIMKIIGMKIRTGKRNTGVKKQPISKEDTKKIADIMKLINMKFRTGKRNVQGADKNISDSKKVQNVAKLAKLTDNMSKRSFSSLRIRYDGWYFQHFSSFTSNFTFLDEQTLQEAFRMMALIKKLVSRSQAEL